ncbi:MAG: VOC family protein [Ignavibacteriales bacterium]|nr:MAG: VOC family protein [Ignavibacteriales bacterium]
MIFEHFALNVTSPKEHATWYVKYCSMKIVKSLNDYPFTHFLSDESGRIILELYSNNSSTVPDYFELNPLQFHFAFECSGLDETKLKLLNAGATLVEEINLPDGSQVVMLRDPFGVPFQLCKRSDTFF